MKFVRYSFGGPVSYGILEDDFVRMIEGTPFMRYSVTDTVYPLDEVSVLEPAVPSKIVAVGLNYLDHAAELGIEPHEEPTLFLKPPSTLIGPGGSIIYPAMSKQVEYEAELAVVIKHICRHVTVARARENILGYTCANDITARDLQKKDIQWTRAKSFDTFCPIGPYIATDVDPNNLAIELTVNGEVRQSSNTSNMHFKPDFLVSFISQIMTLCPGDIVLTGTPPGVGAILPGDEVAVTIEGIGTLANKVFETI